MKHATQKSISRYGFAVGCEAVALPGRTPGHCQGDWALCAGSALYESLHASMLDKIFSVHAQSDLSE